MPALGESGLIYAWLLPYFTQIEKLSSLHYSRYWTFFLLWNRMDYIIRTILTQEMLQ